MFQNRTYGPPAVTSPRSSLDGRVARPEIGCEQYSGVRGVERRIGADKGAADANVVQVGEDVVCVGGGGQPRGNDSISAGRSLGSDGEILRIQAFAGTAEILAGHNAIKQSRMPGSLVGEEAIGGHVAALKPCAPIKSPVASKRRQDTLGTLCVDDAEESALDLTHDLAPRQRIRLGTARSIAGRTTLSQGAGR